MISPDLRIRTACRLCDGPLHLGLQLTPTPPANELVTKEFVNSGQKQDVFPLDVMVCGECAHVQLSAVVNPERLFRQYPYRSGASKQFVDHLQAYADAVYERFEPTTVLEIGSNDGTMLRMFQKLGCKTLGIEPAENIAKIAQQAGIPTLSEFFPTKSIRHWSKFDLIVANHVFAHADDLRGMAAAVRDVLTPDGVFVFEVGYLVDVIEKRLFDVCYHEHVSMHHLWPLSRFFESVGMWLFDAERVDTQGGAIRCYVCLDHRGEGHGQLLSLLQDEYRYGFNASEGVHVALTWLGKEVQRRKEELRHYFWRVDSINAPYSSTVAAYGAPAKATTFLHQFGLGRETIDFVVDDSALKQGLYLPGKQIPILPTSALYERNPHYCLILAWNFADQIMRNNKEYKGKWIVPLPELRVV
jgi:SAM-dependent methyltransferase